MLVVYVQETGGPDIDLRAALRGHGEPGGVYMEGMPSPGVLDLARSLGTLRVAFPEAGLHPDRQAQAGRTLAHLAIEFNVIVATHALPVLYALNNGLLAYPALSGEAYAVGPDGYRWIMGEDHFIDERPLGRASDILGAELNQLCAARRVQRVLTPPETCPRCRAPYEHIGHPLKPGVIMQSHCKCVVRTLSQNGMTTVVLVPPEKT